MIQTCIFCMDGGNRPVLLRVLESCQITLLLPDIARAAPFWTCNSDRDREGDLKVQYKVLQSPLGIALVFSFRYKSCMVCISQTDDFQAFPTSSRALFCHSSLVRTTHPAAARSQARVSYSGTDWLTMAGKLRQTEELLYQNVFFPTVYWHNVCQRWWVWAKK